MVSYLGQAGGEVFRVVILLAGLSVAVPYLLSALALIKLSGGKKTRSESADWRLDGAIATVAAAFSVLVVRGALVAPGTRVDLLVFAAVALAVGIAIYFGMRRVTG